MTETHSINLTGWPAIFAIIITLSLLLLIFLVPMFAASAILRKRAEKFVHDRNDTVVAQYDPPQGLSPAEIGYLYDMKCGEKEVRATLYDLVRRKIVVFVSKSAVAVKNPAAFAKLTAYEQIAVRMHADRTTAQPELATSTLSNMRRFQTEFQVAIPSVQLRNEFTHAVETSLARKGYRTKGYATSMVQQVLKVAVLIGLWPILLTIVTGVTDPASLFGSMAGGLTLTIIAFLFFFPVYIVLAYVLVRIWVAIAGRSWLMNKATRQIWPELEGYKLFLKQVDLDSIRAQANDPMAPFQVTLPYAMVFNLDTKWRR